jgi:hypothetical protein
VGSRVWPAPRIQSRRPLLSQFKVTVLSQNGTLKQHLSGRKLCDVDFRSGVELGSRRDRAEGFHIETKIDRVIQKSGDISQKCLDFSIRY